MIFRLPSIRHFSPKSRDEISFRGKDCNSPKIRIQINKFSYTWPPHVSLSLPSPILLSVLHVAVMAPTLPKPPRGVVAVVEADPGFPAVGDTAKSPTTSPELATCPHSRLRLAPLSFSFSFPGRHERRVSKLTVSSRFASSAPRIPNPPQPKLDNLPSFLPNPAKPSPEPHLVGNQKIPGRPPLKSLGALVAVELPRPIIIFFA